MSAKDLDNSDCRGSHIKIALHFQTFQAAQRNPQPSRGILRNKLSHSWHGNTDLSVCFKTEKSCTRHSIVKEQEGNTAGKPDDILSSPEELVNAFAFLTPEFKSPLNNLSSKASRSINSSVGDDPLYPLFSPRSTSTPIPVSPLPPTPRFSDIASPNYYRVCRRRRLIFNTEDEEAVYYLITKYLMTSHDGYLSTWDSFDLKS